MRNAKKVAVLALAGAMLLCGCTGEKQPGGQEKAEVLDWGIVGIFGYDTDDSITEEEREALNQLLKDNGKDYQIQFHVMPFEEGVLSEENEKILSSCDLITMPNQFVLTSGEVKICSTIEEFIEKGFFEPLDSYMDSIDGEKIKEQMLTEHTLEIGKTDGTQWVLPTNMPSLRGESVCIEKNLYEKIQMEKVEVAGFTKCDALFAKIYEINGQQPFLRLSNIEGSGGINGIKQKMPKFLDKILSSNIYFYDGLGVGSLVEAGSDIDTRNLIETEYVEEMMNAWRRYDEKGYVMKEGKKEPLVDAFPTYKPEVYYWETATDVYVIPKAADYTFVTSNLSNYGNPVVGIGAKSKKKELAFQVLSELTTEQDLNKAVQDLGEGYPSYFVFQPELSEDGKKAYRELIKEAPVFVQECNFDTFHVPEMDTVNEVFAEYISPQGEDLNVLQKYFSEDGKVTEESIHNALVNLNEKLKAAGIDKIVQAYREHKK